jgi:hypothetical protein
MQGQLICRRLGWFRPAIALAALSLCAATQADGPIRYQCSTTLAFGPSRCPGTIAPIQDNSTVEIDLERNLWKSDQMAGQIEAAGPVITLKKWGGGMEGRDVTIDRGSGAFNFHFQSGCLVENQTGNCQPAP